MNLIFQESSLSDRIEDTITESATLDQLALNFQHTLQSALHTLPCRSGCPTRRLAGPPGTSDQGPSPAGRLDDRSAAGLRAAG
ncbi:hypothetical protein [Deinococcus radiophilus]|uniref:hypothetical protein n=1 Tax=Deinococcus radiophilus TaxID=32062 RepID=UPI0036150AE8